MVTIMEVGKKHYQVGYNIKEQFHPARHYDKLIIRRTKRGALKMIEKMKKLHIGDAFDFVVVSIVVEEIVPKTPRPNVKHE